MGAEVQAQIVLIGDSIFRKANRAICHTDCDCRTICCLLGAQAWHIADQMDRLLGGAEKDPNVMVQMTS